MTCTAKVKIDIMLMRVTLHTFLAKHYDCSWFLQLVSSNMDACS